MFPKIVEPPNHPFLIGFSIKPSILGHHYCWKHPYVEHDLSIFVSTIQNYDQVYTNMKDITILPVFVIGTSVQQQK